MQALIEKEQEDRTYRIYISTAAKNICDNIAMRNGGYSMKYSYAEILEPKKEEAKTAEEIINDVVTRAGIEVKN